MNTSDFRGHSRLAAVSYLNTVPLVWGFLTGPQNGLADIDFCLPAECSIRLQHRLADAGLIPVIEVQRQGLPILGDVGIGCRGAVRSILLFSKVPAPEIRTLAADASSRSSVMLARLLLVHHFRNDTVVFTPAQPELEPMLRSADASLIIGDPALRINPSTLGGLYIYDLGEEWWNFTNLPMVFAVWGGYVPFPPEVFREALEYGRSHLDDYVAAESAKRGVPEALAREYLTRHIVYDIGPAERRGMAEYLKLATIMESVPA